ncbi:ABC transporter permease [Rheinheimera sp. SA_1]|uniref:ABC transporter permease n=1 Tax=Rheinheimera sp. SA_1 TaxID=1827365 RepID=UPI0012F7836B|nr:ABC transporter permease [Rheinheimera sp. SA_1]
MLLNKLLPRNIGIYKKSAMQGAVSILKEPHYSLPFIVSFGLMLSIVLTMACIARTLYFQDIPGVRAIDGLQRVSVVADIGPMHINLLTKNTLPELRKEFHGLGDFSFVEFSESELSFEHSTVKVPVISSDSITPTNLGIKVVQGISPSQVSSKREIWISEEVWKQYFQSKSVLGKPVKLDGQDVVIVGVVEHFGGHPDAQMTQKLQVWQFESAQYMEQAAETFGSDRYSLMLYRKKNGEGIEERHLAEWLAKYLERRNDLGISINDTKYSQQDYHQWIIGDSGKLSISLLVVSLFLLFITLLNLTNSSLERFIKLERELAMQIFLGASLTRVRMMTFVELSVWVAVSILIAIMLSMVLIKFSPMVSGGIFPLMETMEVSAIECFFIIIGCMAITAVISVILVPSSLQHKKILIKGIGKGVHSERSTSTFIISIQLVISSLLILTSVGLSFAVYKQNFHDIGLENVEHQFFSIKNDSLDNAHSDRNDEESVRRLAQWQAFVRTLQNVLPDHEFVLADGPALNSSFVTEGLHLPVSHSPMQVIVRAVDPDYHRVLGVNLLSGRLLGAHDLSATESFIPILVDEQFAYRVSATNIQNAVGMEFERSSGKPYKIVGVLKSIKNSFDSPTLYRVVSRWDSVGVLVYRKTEAIEKDRIESLAYKAGFQEKSRWLDNHQQWLDATRKYKLLFYMVLVVTITALVIAVVGIIGCCMLYIRKKRHEIAVYLTCGWSVRHIFLMTMLSLCLSICFSVVAAWFIYYALMERVSFFIPDLELPCQYQTALVICVVALLSAWATMFRIVKLNPRKIFCFE